METSLTFISGARLEETAWDSNPGQWWFLIPPQSHHAYNNLITTPPPEKLKPWQLFWQVFRGQQIVHQIASRHRSRKRGLRKLRTHVLPQKPERETGGVERQVLVRLHLPPLLEKLAPAWEAGGRLGAHRQPGERRRADGGRKCVESGWRTRQSFGRLPEEFRASEPDPDSSRGQASNLHLQLGIVFCRREAK